jgi:pyruvate dehydrogenase E2 component (dihydrolipoamide acetyltransferase)
MRRAIAARMSEAAQTIPHFRIVAEIDVEALCQLRTRLTIEDPDTRLTINDFIIKATATTLMLHPALNIQWTEGGLRQFSDADISVVVGAASGGLYTPIVREANRKSIQRIALEMRSLMEKAATNSLRSSETVGGTFSISNLGMYGVAQFDAIINPPQCAILAVGAVKAPIAAITGELPGVLRRMTLTLSIDHRALDGAQAAQFLAALCRCLEQPKLLLNSDTQ